MYLRRLLSRSQPLELKQIEGDLRCFVEVCQEDLRVKARRSEMELADPDSRFIEIGGVRIHYKQVGSGEPALILLHGFGASVFSWHEVMAALAGHGTVIAYDRPGFGLTQRLLPGEWKGENPYSLPAQVAILIGLMDGLWIEKAILIGHSSGGMVALASALTQTQRFSGLVLVDPAIYSSGGAPAWLKPLLRLPLSDRVGPSIARYLMEKQGRRLIERAWHDPRKITPHVLEGYRKPFQAGHWERALWELTKVSDAGNRVLPLSEIRVPALVLSGDDDRIIPEEQSRRLAQALPDARFIEIEDCGHVPQEECPAPFLAAVTAFVAGLEEDDNNSEDDCA
jgi:pimeloyl-ACP methyl ester carboxylesterase